MNFKTPPLRFKNEYFLFLLPLFFVLHGYNENHTVVYFREALLLLLNYLLIILVLAIPAFLLFRSWRKTAVCIVILMGFHFFFGALHDTAKHFLGNFLLVRYSFILPFVLLFTILFVLALKRTQRPFNKFSNYTNLLLSVLIAIEFIQLFRYNATPLPKPAQAPSSFVSCDSCQLPDVYFIIADAYAGSGELKNVLHFDNSAFENALRSRGFHIVANSRSSYNLTPYSVASILNGDYLHLQSNKENKEDQHFCFQTINENLLTSFFRSRNYKIENCSIFRFNNIPPLVNSMFLNTGVDAITAQTFIGRLNRDIRFNLITRFKLKSEMKRFAESELAGTEKLIRKTMALPLESSTSPRVVYTHLMMPHYPYYLDKDGNFNDFKVITAEGWTLQKEYLGYLQYSNRRFLELIDQILTRSKRPPVIIFMGDHGFREFSSGDISPAFYFMNLNAIYLPGKNYEKFYDGMSGVNQIRMILNTQFHQQLPLLKDSSIFIK